MPGRARKYTLEQEGQFKIAALDILNNSEEALTLDEIKSQNLLVFSGVSTQKISRILGQLNDLGLVKKSKSKAVNKMIYKSVSKMLEQGYSV